VGHPRLDPLRQLDAALEVSCGLSKCSNISSSSGCLGFAAVPAQGGRKRGTAVLRRRRYTRRSVGITRTYLEERMHLDHLIDAALDEAVT
jgi:hypothetical protein